MRILLKRNDIDPYILDPLSGCTQLSLAAPSYRDGVVRVPPARNDIDPNRVGTNGETPLFTAVKYGNECVVKILIKRKGINTNTPVFGKTPLWCAACRGFERVVRLLLERLDKS